MLRRSTWSRLVLSAAVSATCVLSSLVRAQDATAPAAAPATAPATAAPDLSGKPLSTLADDFLHYSLVNNQELAQANAQAILSSGAKPEDVLKAFEDVSQDRDYHQILLQDARRPDLKDTASKLSDLLDEGFRNVARDPVRIRQEVDRLGSGPRAYENAKARLVAAGQYAAPIFIEYLQNNTKRDLYPAITRVMGEIGRPLLNPLIEELRVSDPTLRIEVINVIGQIGYPQALPALRALQADANTPVEMKAAVDNAIALIDHTGQAVKMTPAELYLRGGQNFYDRKASYLPLLPDEKTNPIWIFDSGLNNITPVQVPTPIWNSVMALRMAEATLKIDATNAEAISLWLAADARRELLLPAGATDPTLPENARPAAFYMQAAGPTYVNPVLAKALDAHDAALALRAIEALDATGGAMGLVSGPDSPLARALSYPDRSVRFHAAFVLASANPPSQFASFYRVVPILAEAVGSNGSPAALLIVSDDDQRNAITDVLRNSDAHFSVYSGSTLSAALESAQRVPGFDIVVVPDGPEVSHVTELSRTDYRLTGAPVVVTAPAASVADLKLRMAEMKGYGVVDEKADAKGYASAIQGAQADAGAVALTPDAAAKYASRALELLGALAADHHTIYSVNEAVPALVEALKDKRPEIVTAAARDLGEMNSPDAEHALAAAALASDADPALRVVYFDQLAESAKRTGNTLDAGVIDSLIKVVSTDADPKTRDAASRALGALNVPSNQASTLILQQAK